MLRARASMQLVSLLVMAEVRPPPAAHGVAATMPRKRGWRFAMSWNR
jgi:hypothetical protein